MTNVKKVPELRFSGFTDEWEEKKLREVFEFRKGKGISKRDLSDKGTKCILYGQLYTIYNEVIENVESYTEIDEEKLLLSKNGDILIPSSGETALDMSLSSALLLDGIALGGDINILRSKDNNIDSIFMSYQINSVRKLDLAKIAEGASVVHLYNSSLENIKATFPSLAEQEKIGSFFSSLDKKLDLQKDRLEELKSYKKAMMQRIFDQEIRFKDENGRNYPDWEEKRLGEVIVEINKRRDRDDLKILSSTIDGVYYQEEYFKNRIASNDTSNYKILTKNQIVFSPQNIWMGNINFNDSIEEGIVSPSYKIFEVINEVNDLYIKYLIKTPKMLYEYKVSSEQGASVVRRNLNMTLFKNIKINLPSFPEQEKIASLLSGIDKKIELEEERLEGYEEFKKGLMQRMFV